MNQRQTEREKKKEKSWWRQRKMSKKQTRFLPYSKKQSNPYKINKQLVNLERKLDLNIPCT